MTDLTYLIDDLADDLRRWPSYPEYRDSGVEWLGEIPAHWEVKRVKNLDTHGYIVQTGPFGAQLHAGDYVEEGIPLILIRNVNNFWIDDSDIPRVTEEDANRLSVYRLRKGDIVFSRVGSIGRIALCTEREEGWLISGQMLRLRIHNSELYDRFLLFAFSSEPVLKFVELKSVGSTRESINTDILKNLPIPLSPLSEQHAIAAFLERKTAHIDALIAKKREFIATLQEKRSAVISHAVTKGLNPDAPMRDSRIEWLGEIPAGWEAVKLKFVTHKIGSGKTPKGGAEIYVTSGVLFIRSQNVHFDGLRLDDAVFIDKQTDLEMSETRVKPNDVLLNITGASLGRCSFVPPDFYPANVNQHVCIIRPCPNLISGKFLHSVLSSDVAQRQIFINENGVSREGLTFNQIANLWVAFPKSLTEQALIMQHIDSETAHIDALIAKTEETITVLQEYRAALISAAVTGKIDVRGE